MGSPANLPDFRQLALSIAEKTGYALSDSEREDDFLDRLKRAGPDVHQLVAQLLQRDNPAPTDLHRNLLRLYSGPEEVRVVTTNFDPLFEQAATNLFSPRPKIFQAPALPLGQRFQGIIQIHGSVNEPAEMILTSEDFGRAYLTEADGWARRFLVDLFAEFTVLFIGYSHNDTLMNYLSRSLPRQNNDRRYVLIGDQSDDPRRWLDSGIQPIAFRQEDRHDYSGLDSAVETLANLMRRGILEWQREITEIANRPPPFDDESQGIIENVLNNPSQTHFFTAAAEHPDWIAWLDRRGYFDALFTGGELDDQDKTLAYWLASRYMATHPDELLAEIQIRAPQLNHDFWRQLCWQLHMKAQQLPNPDAISRWATVLTAISPKNADAHFLLLMAESCADAGLTDNLLQVYDEMTANFNRKLDWSTRGNSQDSLYAMETLWGKRFKPNLSEIAEPLLRRTTLALENRFSIRKSLWQATRTGDSDSFHRSAIEPHEQNNFRQVIDVLIDIARDCLEWLSPNQMATVKSWSEHNINAQAPLLRRLAVHCLSARNDLSPDGKIDWILDSTELHDVAAHHEVFRAVSEIYPQAGLEKRKGFIEAVLTYQWPIEDDPDKDLMSAHHRFRWLDCLHKAAPDCGLTKHTLDEIIERHPDFQSLEHPDLTHYWRGFRRVHGEPSLWTVSEILEQSPTEWLAKALEENPSEHPLHPRSQLIDNLEEAVKQNPDWGFELADAMVKTSTWDTHLWRGTIDGWSGADLNEDSLVKSLEFLSQTELYDYHAAEIAAILGKLIAKNQLVVNQTALHLANTAARILWQSIPPEDRMPTSDWTMRALSHPAGDLARFWTLSISTWRSLQESAPDELNDEYRDALSEMVANRDLRGTLVKVMLTAEIAFLAFVDEVWVHRNLITLLSPNHPDFVPAWYGLTHLGSVTPRTAELLKDPLLEAIEHIGNEPDTDLQIRFITLYTQLLAWSADSPTDEWITKLFIHGNEEARTTFARRIAHNLLSLEEKVQIEWWTTWLKGYWQNRLLGVPVTLDDAETEAMLEWTYLLTAIYPEAVELAVQMRPVTLHHATILHQLKESVLVDKYPESVAKLLIHLSKAEEPQFMWYGTAEIIERLRKHDLDAETAIGLDEVMAILGL